jgi:hypothetical protein
MAKIPTANTLAMMGRMCEAEGAEGNGLSCISLAPVPLVVRPRPDSSGHRVVLRPSFIMSAQYRAHETGLRESARDTDVVTRM